MTSRRARHAPRVRPDSPNHVLLMLGVLWRVNPGRDGDARADRLIDPVVDDPRHVPAAHQVARRPAREGVIGR
ncbi:hypothetical protein ACWC9U_21495 [Streptomyces sp. 900116325]